VFLKTEVANIVRVCTVNLALIAFLALKNTPLAFLTAYSYDQLNILHRMAGYVTVSSMLFHTFIEIASNVQNNRLATFKEFSTIMGSVAGMCMLIMGITAVLLRKMQYETFYTIHITLFLLCVVATAFHHPDPDDMAIWAMVFVGAIWSFDRLLRIARISYYAAGNNATVTALPNGGIRIVIKRNSVRAVAGSHIFLWIPSIRAFETHPFTISETSPLTVVVKAHDGFTKSLLKKATENPGAVLRASMEGPYGIVPNLNHFDYFIFIAGGSGGTYTFGLACDLVRRLGPNSQTVIDFVWSVRNEGAFSLE
jgi:predicted ferric reductase